MSRLLSLSIFTAVVGSSVLGGIFFSWSNLVMPALTRISPPAGIAAMNATNEVVQNPLFFLFFLGVPLLALVLAAGAVMQLRRPGSPALIAGAVLLVAGMFAVTMGANVPMNDTLAAMAPDSAEAADYWQIVVDRWTFWNHVRTIASLAAAVCFGLALRARSNASTTGAVS